MMRTGHAAPVPPIKRYLWAILIAPLPVLSAVPPNVAPTPTAPTDARLALVMGNGAYRHASPLSNPPNDARLVAETLASLGFQLVSGGAVVDGDRPAMERAIRTFGKRLRGGAIGLFYYAGHGVQMEGENYLVPVTADIEDAADVKYELISVDYVLDEMRNAGNRLNIVVLDACRNNPFGGRALRAMTRGLAVMQAPAGTIISYATQPGNTATDGAGANSPFTRALTTAMKRPGLGVFETFNQVGLAVKAETGGQQQPWVANSPIEGGFQFRPALSTPPPPPAGGPSTAEDRAFWESVRDSKRSAELKAYLKAFPHGIYADLAKARLDSLKAAPSVPTASGRTNESHGSATKATSPDAVKRRDEIGKILKKYEGRAGFVLATYSTTEQIQNEQKKAQLEPDEEVLAALHYLHGDWLVFGSKNIYSRQYSASPEIWRLAYRDLADRQFSKSGWWWVKVSPGLEIDTSGTRFTRADLVELLSDLRQLVINNPGLFARTPRHDGD